MRSMALHDHSLPPTTARQTLVEASGTPFAPSPAVRPVVAVLDGRLSHDAIDPDAWRRALVAADGDVAIYFKLADDKEWWLAYDANGEYERDLDGPYQRWTTYPRGSWNHAALPAGILEHNLVDLYGEDDPEMDCDIYRSRVVLLEDAPEFVRQEVGGGY